MSKHVTHWFALAVACTLTATGCEKLDLGKAGKAESTQPPAQSAFKPTPGTTPGTPVPTVQLPDFTALVEREGPAVVNVSVTQTLTRGSMQFPGADEDDPFFDFFRRFTPQQPRRGEAPMQQGLGSGFIISQDGYVLTNRHVVANADTVIVKLTDKREFKAKVVGTDSRTDVALLKVDAKDLPTVPIGDASHIRVGEWVLAIGAPFGFENSVTAGIVSAINRALPEENFVPFIQTDVAINPGNSGGPLFNMKGEVVGINSQIYSRTGGFMGLSFAIPIDVAIDVANQLKSTGRVSRGRIGVQIQSLTPELAGSFGLQDAKGALVASIEKGSPADKAGLQPGDVIREYDGKQVVSSAELPRLVGMTKPGAVVKMKVWRKGEAKELTATVTEMPGERVAGRAGDHPTKQAEKIGLTLSESEDGIVVQDANGPAARAGLRPGDIILSLNNQRVQTVDEFRDRLSKMPSGKSIALLVQREDTTLFVPIRPEG
ncbi:MAG: DegQ family serine endoprotease [Pseudomonadota bacterium]